MTKALRYHPLLLAAAVLTTIFAQSGCVTDPYKAGEPDSLFSEFVLVRDLMDSRYACFVARPELDWTELYMQYRGEAQNLSSRSEMIDLCLSMLGELEDMGIALYDPSGNRYGSCDGDYFYNWDWNVLGSCLVDWGGTDTLTRYYSFRLAPPLDSIGYMYVRDLGDSYDIMSFFGSTAPIQPCSRLILDLRLGLPLGHEINAQYSVGRFTASPELGYYRSFRNGPDRMDMTEPDDVYAIKNGSWQFKGPIIVLTGRQTQGALEQFLLLLRSQDHVTVMGDSTAGYPDPTTTYNLTEGWSIEIPRMVTYDPDMNLIFDAPIPPDILIPCSEEDFISGIDPVLDAALEACTSAVIR